MRGEPEPLTREQVLRQLRELAKGRAGPLFSRDLSTVLRRAMMRHFGSMDAARKAARLAPARKPRRWSREVVIAEIQRLSRAGVAITDAALMAAGRKDLPGAIRNYFPTIGAARRAARVPEPERPRVERVRWDGQMVIDEIQERYAHGESLAHSKAPLKLRKAGMRFFESWQGAVEAAGFDYEKVRLTREPWDEDEILDELRKLRRSRPNLTLTELQEYKFHPALVRIFGSTEAAAERAGLEGWPIRLREKLMPIDDVVAGLEARHSDGKATTWQAVQDDEFTLWSSAMTHFGDWWRALEAAGIETGIDRRRWTRATMIEALREWMQRGHSLKPAEMLRDDPRLVYSARAYFGGYLNAVLMVMHPPWALTRWTKDMVVDALKRASKDGHVTVAMAGHTLAGVCQTHFGSFSAACRAAQLTCGWPTAST